jgi:membrane-associated phospholipid phosphatase
MALRYNKQRPDGSDWMSFPSEHTAIAFALSGWSVGYGYTIGLGTASSRVYANKHDKIDVTAGALIGAGGQWVSQRIFRCATP